MIDHASLPVRPRSLKWISLLLLLWNLAGVAAFASQWQMATTALETLPPAQREMWQTMPGWAWAAYAIAVFAGTAGAVGLLLRKAWSTPLFALSLVAVLVQFTYPFLIANGLQTLGASALIFPAFVIIMAALQLWLARRWRAAGWLG